MDDFSKMWNYTREKVSFYGQVAVVSLLLLLRPLEGSRKRVYDRSRLTSDPIILFNTPTNYTAYVGDLAVLKCSVENLGTKSVVWRKTTAKTPLTVGMFTFVGDSRYQIHHVIHQDQWNLHIRNVSIKDEGVYECQIPAKDQEIRRRFNLKVLKRTSVINITGKTYVDRGQRMRLVCNASGNLYPPEDLDWFKDGRQIFSDLDRGVSIRKIVSLQDHTVVSSLEIAHMALDDAGTYVCRASETMVTNVKVNVLNANSSNVKRGTVQDRVSALHPMNGTSSSLMHKVVFEWTLVIYICLTYLLQ